MQHALSGVRICDFTGQLAGAGATKWLSAFGAEVIRIEDPVRQGRWDILRGMEPFKEGQRGLDYGGGFNNHNTDKLGITLNVRTERGKELLTELIKISDVVSENFAAGVLEKWGFGYSQLKAIKEDIIYVSNCGFGHQGPYSQYKTWGPIVQAVSGLTYTSALPDQEPAGWGYSYMDHSGGYYMAMAIMLALLHKQNTGEGQWVDLACTDAALTLNGPALLDHSINGTPTPPSGSVNSNRSQYLNMAPHGIYRCSGDDNWIALSIRNQQEWSALAQYINASWTRDFDNEDYRLKHQDALDTQINQWTCNFDKSSLSDALQKLPVPASPVLKPQERIDIVPDTEVFGLWPTVEHSAMGDVRVDGLPVHLSETDWQMQRGAPCLGEHNHDVLSRLLGLNDDEIETLAAEGVI
ncbi:MAG: CoA transferase [Pseudomonadaceae bacterium]|nr:CoA transferase [Pseudomonadaceae bacterium]